MNGIVKTITACALMLVMTAISPMTDLTQSISGSVSGSADISGAGIAKAATISKAGETDSDGTVAKAATIAKAAETDGQGEELYISDIRLGNAYYSSSDGPTEDQVVAELERDGYIVLRDGSDYADLNAGADAPSIKEGPHKKKVLLGYKTTTDPDDAITDLAVMNMDGGYSVEDYETLIQTQMDSQIKPFVDRFIATLNEYRENYKKPANSVNHIRADKMRTYLNNFLDDDTGGKPIGDLLLNKTKYEMGDAAYNKLSDEEKKDHADILTMLLQGNGRAILTIETLLTEASDAADDTWYERFVDMSLDDLVEEVKAKQPNLTTRADIYKELDKKYQDSAKEILKKWSDFRAEIDNYEEKAEDIVDSLDDASKTLDEIILEDVENITVNDVKEAVDASAQTIFDAERTGSVLIAAFLSSTKYEDGTLYDFFTQDYKDVSEGNAIRKLYPMVEALSEGQLAGLTFVSLADLFTMALTGEDGYTGYEGEKTEAVSVYEGINREIFDVGGVALTNEALRSKNATNDDTNNIFGVSDMSLTLKISWICTIGAVGGLAFSVAKVLKSGAGTIAKSTLKPEAIPEFFQNSNVLAFQEVSKNWNNLIVLERYYAPIKLTEPIEFVDMETLQTYNGMQSIQKQINYLKEVEKQGVDVADDISDVTDDAVEFADDNSTFWKQMSLGFSFAVVLLLTISIVMTVSQLKEHYKTDYSLIPKYIVEEVDITAINERGERVMIENQTAYYKVVTCNRIEGKSDQEKNNYKAMLDRSDVNGDIGKQWLALYAVKYKNGTPILADSLLYQKDSSSVPSGYSTGIHEFGGKAAANLNRKAYLFNSGPPSIHVYFKNAAPAVNTSVDVNGDKDSDSGADSDSKAVSGSAGSIFSDGSESGSGITATGVALGGGIGIVLGALLMALILYLSRRKKITIEKK